MNQKLSKILSDRRILILVLNYFVGYMYVYPTILSFIQSTSNLSNQLLDFLTWLIYIAMILISCLVGAPVLKESFEKKPKFNKLFESVLLSFVALYFISVLSNVLITLISGLNMSENQNQVISAFKQNPVLIIFTTLIYAPIVEEMVFRGAIFRGLRSKTNFLVAALISGFLFGFIHVFDSFVHGNFQDLWYILTYGSLGILFCYVYEKNHTIFGSILLHFMNNFLGLIGIILSIFVS